MPLGNGLTQTIIQSIIPAEDNAVYDNRQDNSLGRLGLGSKVQVLKSRLHVYTLLEILSKQSFVILDHCEL